MKFVALPPDDSDDDTDPTPKKQAIVRPLITPAPRNSTKVDLNARKRNPPVHTPTGQATPNKRQRGCEADAEMIVETPPSQVQYFLAEIRLFFLYSMIIFV